MEAHSQLKKKGYDIESYGTGNFVKIPGKSAKEPNVYEFGTTYEAIHKDLTDKDKKMYTESGMLHILSRNMRIKERPEKFQLETSKEFNIILTCEERVYDAVVEHFANNDSVSETPVHVINVDIVDNPDDAIHGAFMFCELMSALDRSPDLDDEIDEILTDFEAKCQRSVLHNVSFYWNFTLKRKTFLPDCICPLNSQVISTQVMNFPKVVA